MDRITQKGVDLSFKLLHDGGYLSSPPGESQTLNLLLLIDACERYVEDSVAKGASRTDEETQDGVLILFFQAYLKETLMELL